MSPGERVYAAVPAALGSLPDDQPPNRLGLAGWLIAPENPLTARVLANRFWETLFRPRPRRHSRGLQRGERPSHPELLDWLAVSVRRAGARRPSSAIVTSATYRQSSVTPALRERDSDNRLLARATT